MCAFCFSSRHHALPPLCLFGDLKLEESYAWMAYLWRNYLLWVPMHLGLPQCMVLSPQTKIMWSMKQGKKSVSCFAFFFFTVELLMVCSGYPTWLQLLRLYRGGNHVFISFPHPHPRRVACWQQHAGRSLLSCNKDIFLSLSLLEEECCYGKTK